MLEKPITTRQLTVSTIGRTWDWRTTRPAISCAIPTEPSTIGTRWSALAWLWRMAMSLPSPSRSSTSTRPWTWQTIPMEPRSSWFRLTAYRSIVTTRDQEARPARLILAARSTRAQSVVQADAMEDREPVAPREPAVPQEAEAGLQPAARRQVRAQRELAVPPEPAAEPQA